MEIDKIFDSNSIDSVADNVFGAVNNSVSEVREMQRKKVAENVQLIVQALKKIEQDIVEKYDDIGSQLEKRITSIKDGKDGINGKDGRDGKDGKPGKDGKAGKDGKDGRPGLDGVDGQDGVSVVDAHIDFDGSLIIHLSTGKEINVGEVVAPDIAEKIKVITNGGGTSQDVIDTLASLQSQIDSLLPSQTGNSGKFLTTDGTNTSWEAVPEPSAATPTDDGLVFGLTDSTASTPSPVSAFFRILDYVPNIIGVVDASGFAVDNVFTSLGASVGSHLYLTITTGNGYISTGTYYLGTIYTYNVNTGIFAITNPNNVITTTTTGSTRDYGDVQGSIYITPEGGNTSLGYQSNTSGGRNTIIGYGAGSTVTLGYNLTIVGYDAEPTSATVANEATFGNSSTTNTRLFGSLSMGGTSAGSAGQVLTSTGPGTAPTWSTPSGTVTSVGQSFTGGLISVSGSPITSSGTLALTVAGTSGGIPYFSSASTWASSAELAANSLVIGGGAGAAPATTTTGTGVVTALGVNVGTAGAFVVNGGDLGTPSSGTVTNLTGTASININGTVGATTPASGAFTTLTASSTATLNTLASSGATLTGGTINGMAIGGSTAAAGAFTTLAASGAVTLSGGTANGIAYLDGSKVLTTGTALTYSAGSLSIINGVSGGSVDTNYDELVIRNNGRAGINILSSSDEYTAVVFGGGTGKGGMYYKADTNTLSLAASDNFGLNMVASSASTFIGIGATPSAWNSGMRAIDIGTYGGIGENSGGGGGTALYGNCYEYGSSQYRYKDSYYATLYRSWAGQHQFFTAASGTAGNAISFTQAMTLDASGNLLVGETSGSFSKIAKSNSGSYVLQVTNTNYGAGDGVLVVKGGNGGSGPYLINCESDSTAVFRVYGNGTYGTVSDIRLKKNVDDARGYLSDLMSLRVVKYNWKTQEDGEPKELGFIAQEVEQVFPALVESRSEEDNKLIKQAVLLPMLVKAIQELKAEFDAYKASHP